VSYAPVHNYSLFAFYKLLILNPHCRFAGCCAFINGERPLECYPASSQRSYTHKYSGKPLKMMPFNFMESFSLSDFYDYNILVY